MRRYILSTTVNTRDLGGYPTKDGGVTAFGRFLRSDCPSSLSQEDLNLLKDLNLTDVIDFRSNIEDERQPNPLYKVEGLNIHRMIFFDPMKDHSIIHAPSIEEAYLGIAEHEIMAKTLGLIYEAKGAVLFHCSAGKDRTGTTAALLQLLAGCDDVDIIADYVLSNTYMKNVLDRYKENEEIPSEWIYPVYESMERFLQLFHAKYPSVEEFYASRGFSPEEIEDFKNKLRVL